MRNLKVVAALVGAVVAILILSTAAGAQQYPPATQSASVDKSSVASGGTVTVSGACPSANATVAFKLTPGDANLGSTTSDAAGSYSKTVTIPSGTAAGSYQIVVTCTSVLGEVFTRNVAVSVAAAGTSTGTAGTATARTGGALTIPLTIAAILLIAAGSLAVVGARRRRLA